VLPNLHVLFEFGILISNGIDKVKYAEIYKDMWRLTNYLSRIDNSELNSVAEYKLRKFVFTLQA
jgi:hypothetical protein